MNFFYLHQDMKKMTTWQRVRLLYFVTKLYMTVQLLSIPVRFAQWQARKFR